MRYTPEGTKPLPDTKSPLKDDFSRCAADPSRLAASLVAHIPTGMLALAPCHPGASAALFAQVIFSRLLSRRPGIDVVRSTLWLVAQPTTRLENRSSMTARYSQPWRVQRNVMSVTQDSSGPCAAMSRFGAMGKVCFESVILRQRRRVSLTQRPPAYCAFPRDLSLP